MRAVSTFRSWRIYWLPLLAVSFGLGPQLRAETPSKPAATSTAPAPLSAEAFLDHVKFLASDELAGRGVGTEGIDKAADYIAKHFAAAGLKPGGDNGTFFQTFEIQLQPVLGDGSKVAFSGPAADELPSDLAAQKDFIPFPFSGEIVFAGYGIQNPDKDHDDYVHLDAEGKVVLMLRGEPTTWANTNGESTPHAAFTTKSFVARERGAAAVLIVNQAPDEGEVDELYTWPRMLEGGLGADCGLPVFHISRRVADALVTASGRDRLELLQQQLDRGEYVSGAVGGIKAEGQAAIVRATKPTRNVVGAFPGDGPMADEYLVVGAHYDHLGITVPRTTFGKKEAATAEPLVHNGADDNASGTAGVIELARVLTSRGPTPRSLLFVAFSAEETGLLGSKHFVEHPTVPLEKMVAMINLDMVGRLTDKRTVQVFGTDAAEEFKDLLPRLAERHKLEFKGSGSAFGPSDHTSFYAKKVPAIHFFTGLHTDYHLPSDDVDKINASGAAEVLAYIEEVANEIVKAENRPTYVHVAPSPGGGRMSFRVRMGLMPSYADSTDGMGVDGVLDGSPAAEAGMKDGDVIIKIGGAAVRNVYDYMAALNRFQPGDVAEVIVRREGQEVTLQVKLAGG